MQTPRQIVLQRTCFKIKNTQLIAERQRARNGLT